MTAIIPLGIIILGHAQEDGAEILIPIVVNEAEVMSLGHKQKSVIPFPKGATKRMQEENVYNT